MIKQPTRPSLFRIVQSDYIALIAVGFPAVMWGMYIMIAYFGFFPGLRGHDAIRGTESAPFFLNLALVSTLVLLPLLVWRVRSFQAIFSRADEVAGQVTSINFFRDRGRVEYTYEYGDQKYNGGNAIMKNKRTTALVVGGNVVLLVDRNNPKHALIRDLYV